MMRQGTVSVLFGCHSPVHSLIVLIAWRKVYHHCPQWWEIACVFLHDIGHWGKDYLDNYDAKREHALLGAKVARRLFGQKGYDMVAGHNPYQGQARSALYYPDKYSWTIAPIWWMASNCLFEHKLIRKGCGIFESARMFKDAMLKNMETGFHEQGHDIYMKQWGHYQNNELAIKEVNR